MSSVQLCLSICMGLSLTLFLSHTVIVHTVLNSVIFSSAYNIRLTNKSHYSHNSPEQRKSGEEVRKEISWRGQQDRGLKRRLTGRRSNNATVC